MDDVHRCHRQSSPIDHAGNVPVQCNVVQAMLPQLGLFGILLGVVAQAEDVGVPVCTAVIELELGIHCSNTPVVGLSEGVDLQQRGISLDRKLVQLDHGISSFLDTVTLEPESARQRSGLLHGEPLVDVDLQREDVLRGFLGHPLDVHTALRRGHHHVSGRELGVEHDGKVAFFLDVQAFCDEYFVDRLAVLGGLVGDEAIAQHLAGVVDGIWDGLCQLNAALEPSIEGPLPAPAGQNLSLDDEPLGVIVRNQLLCHCLNRVSILNNKTPLHVDPARKHLLLGDILMDM
mmetsp:Transcript_28044/g.47570  ORF Transcript_28044/g.47570 Transcript_28044/m.47570 type:complete len:289 (+) Transcript_28044:1555-2421(+)